jgi:hypothetical protein
VPYGDFTRLNHLLLASLTADCVTQSLEENAEKSAIVAGYLSWSASNSRRVSSDAQHARRRCVPETNLNVERSCRIRKDIQSKPALGECAVEVISIAIARVGAVIPNGHKLILSRSALASELRTQAEEPTHFPTARASWHLKYSPFPLVEEGACLGDLGPLRGPPAIGDLQKVAVNAAGLVRLGVSRARLNVEFLSELLCV